MKNWINMLFVVTMTLSLTACGDGKKATSESGDNKSVQQKDASSNDVQPKGDEQKQPPQKEQAANVGGGQDAADDATPPKSRIFSSIGRAFLKGTSGDDSANSQTVSPDDGDTDDEDKEN